MPVLSYLHQLFNEALEDIEGACFGPFLPSTILAFKQTIAELLHGIRRARPSPP